MSFVWVNTAQPFGSRQWGVVDSQYYDRTIPADQVSAQVSEVAGGTHTFDAEPPALPAGRRSAADTHGPRLRPSVRRVRVQVDPLPHQLDAVYGHILQPRIRFLLADDPGAGKTIMAGLLMRELMQRGEVSRVLVLCPEGI